MAEDFCCCNSFKGLIKDSPAAEAAKVAKTLPAPFKKSSFIKKPNLLLIFSLFYCISFYLSK
jgi:hypothetical protein